MFQNSKVIAAVYLERRAVYRTSMREQKKTSRASLPLSMRFQSCRSPAAPTASPPTEPPTSTAKSSTHRSSRVKNPPVSSTERLQSDPIISPSTPPKSVNSANLDTQSPIKIANTAELSVEMLPASLSVSARKFHFGSRARKPGMWSDRYRR